MKSLILASLLLLPVGSLASSVPVIDPMPECYPCPPERPRPAAPTASDAPVLPLVDAR